MQRTKKSGRGKKRVGGVKKELLSRGSNVGTSVFIPPRRFLATHVAGTPQSVRRTVVVAGSNQQTLTFATYGEYTQIMNSAYNGGGVAAGYAKLMAFYSKCFVLGARIRVDFALSDTSSGATNTEPTVFGVTITTNSTTLGTITKAIEAGLCDWRELIQNPDSASLTLGVDIAKFLDKPQVLDDSQLFSTSGADPSQVVVAHIWAQNVSSISSVLFTTYLLEYDCVFTDPIPFT